VTDIVFANPTVIVPKSMSFGLKLRIPSLPAPIMSISYLTVAGAASYNYFVLFNPPEALSIPDPGL
jgi:hypothetical protein